jgi:hypothetical protein
MTRRVVDFRYAPRSVWTSICRPDDPYKTLVREDGALLYGFNPVTFYSWTFERVMEFSVDGAEGPIKTEQFTESAKIPIVVTRLFYPHVMLELRAFGHLDDQGDRTDVVLWSITAHDNIDEVLVAFHIDAFSQQHMFLGRVFAPIPAPAHIFFAVDIDQANKIDRWASASVVAKDEVSQEDPGKVAFIASPQTMSLSHPAGFRPCTGLSTTPTILKAGETYSGAVIFPLNHANIFGLDYKWAQAALYKERTFWHELTLMHTTLQVPDNDVMDMITACARNILQAREIEDGLPVYKVGPTVYRSLYVVDGHFFLEAAQYLGDSMSASRALDTLLRRVHEDGSIYEMAHHTKETGISIATIVRQTELLGDDERLLSLWSVIQNAVAYIEHLRAESKKLPADHPCRNLLPQAYGDGGIGGNRGEYTTTFWMLIGLKSVADAAQRLGLLDDAKRFRRNFDELLLDFRLHATREMKSLADGTPYLPIKFDQSSEHHWFPNYIGEVPRWHRLQPQSGTWALCQAIYPGEVFAADDPLTHNLLTLYEQTDNTEGIPEDTGWLPYRAVWVYHAGFAANVWLYNNRPEKAVDYLYEFANHASTTRVWREEQSLVGSNHGQLFGDMPHNWASVEFVRLVRNLLVFERGDTLELLPGLPKEWMRDRIDVQNMPSRFGKINLSVDFSLDGVIHIEYNRLSTGHRNPHAVKLFLRGMTDVIVNGTARVPHLEAVILPDTLRVSVTAQLVRIMES